MTKTTTNISRIFITMVLAILMFKMVNMTAYAKENTLAVFGDSYSTWNNTENKADETYYYPYFAASKGNDVKSENETWPNLVANKIGAELRYRNAISGSRLTRTSESDDKAIIDRIEKSPKNVANTIILMGGLNDLWQNVNCGVIHNEFMPAAYDFAPALQRALRVLRMKNPDAKIVYAFIAYDKTAIAYDAVAREICTEEQVTYIPISGIACIDYHPTVRGMEQIADAIVATIK